MTIDPPLFMQDLTYSARRDRNGFATLFEEGVVDLDDLMVSAHDTPDMGVEVAIGHAIIEGDDAANQGNYAVHVTAAHSAVITASDGTLPRIDLVIMRVRDSNEIGGTDDDAIIEVLAGTPDSDPEAPALPDTAIALAQVQVAALVDEITDDAITDLRPIAELKPNTTRPHWSVEHFGKLTPSPLDEDADPDVIERNTGIVQAALDFGGKAFIPWVLPGLCYQIGPVGVTTGSEVFGLRGRSVLKAMPDLAGTLADPKVTNSQGTSLIEPKDFVTTTVTDVYIHDLVLYGNSAGQWEGGPPGEGASVQMIHGIRMNGTLRWTVRRVAAHDFDGDGIYFGRGFGAAATSPVITRWCIADDCDTTGNMRNGMMFGWSSECKILNSRLQGNQQAILPSSPKYTGTLDPYTSAELDIEPNAPGAICNYHEVRGCSISGPGKGIQNLDANPSVGVKILDNLISDCPNGLMAIGALGSVDWLIEGNQFIVNDAGEQTASVLRVYGATRPRFISNLFRGGTDGTNKAVLFDDGGAADDPVTGAVLARNVFDFDAGGGDAEEVRIAAEAVDTVMDDNVYAAAHVTNLSSTTTGRDFAEPGFLYAEKPSDDTVNNNATPAPDGDLTLAVEASSAYRVFAFLIIDGAATADFRLSWAAPAGSTMTWAQFGPGTGAANNTAVTMNVQPRALADSGVLGAAGAGVPVVACPVGTLHTDATAGDLTLRWAQGTAEVSDTKLLAGSHLYLVKVG